MTETLPLFVTCPRGLEPLLVTELIGLGATEAKERRGGVACSGPPDLAYRASLWSRLASRVLLPLTNFPLVDADGLYAGARTVDWPALFAPDSSFVIEVAGHSPAVTHTHFAGLKVKDAIADTFRERCGRRPDVNTDEPDMRVHLHLDRAQATLSLDLSGESLHRRGYRGGTGEAPLKENLACAILLRADWPRIAAEGGVLLDPMCGSGTFLIEGAWMAADIAPGLMRGRFGFEHWLAHRPAVWHELKRDAQSRRDRGLARLPRLIGRDLDERVLHFARKNALNAGLKDAIEWVPGDLMEMRPPDDSTSGLVVTNPPYGERMAAEGEVIKLYSLLGATLKSHFPGWRAAIFTSRPDLGPRIGLRADAMHSFYNGDLLCKLLQFGIAAPAGVRTEATEEPGTTPAAVVAAPASSPSEFANRLAKNRRHLGKWARRMGITCYRVYDADLPDYALAVDVYETCEGELHLHVQEYAAPKTIDPVKAEKRLREALSDLQAAYGVPASRLHFKQRSVQRGTAQYEKQGDALRVLEIEEQGSRLLVNLDDYLDTGLFFDHRPMRLRLRSEAQGKRVLNLFCYTGAASVQAALGGAIQTVSVDLSNTYLHWAGRNLRLNGFEVGELASAPPQREGGSVWRGGGRRRSEAPSAPHLTARADCMAWLREAAEDPARRFDLVFCDPPTFSNSKKLEGVFEVERDHPELIGLAMGVLAPGGTLYFSTNKRRFKLDPAAVEGLDCEDITAQTLDEDFRRPPPPHRAWRIRQPGA
ncbi:MAG: bifunctional 23S rRNA (guanine(2069)-N(7))-methyltransferase RlmK/23S rRNA (guanine(2445)-N(2))-methyltransferase RlmL [Panacagrimonas sp.]